RSSQETEYACDDTQAHSVNNLPFRRDRRRHIIRSHEPCAQHEAAAEQVAEQIIHVKSHTGPKHITDHKHSERPYVGKRNLKINDLKPEKDHRADKDRKS